MLAKRAAFRGASAKDKDRILYLLGAVLVLEIILLLPQITHSQTFIKATTHQPETYTELYFTNPSQLPTVALIGHAVPVNFTIHNVESRSMNYVYTINLTVPGGKTTVISSSQLSLSNGATKKIATEAVLPDSAGRDEISVKLVGEPEVIHYWIEATS